MSTQVGHNTIQDILRDRRATVLQMGVAIGLLAAAAAAGLLTTRVRMDPIMILIAGVGVLGLIAWTRVGRFEQGILAIAITGGLLNFFTIPTGTQSRIPVSLGLALGLTILWILQMVAVDKSVRLKPSPINSPALAFIGISIIAYVWSNLMRDPLVFVPRSFGVVQIAALTVNVFLPVLALLVSNKIEETRWLKQLAWILLGLGVFKLVSVWSGLPISSFIDNGSRGVFAAWVGAFAYALVLFDQDLPRWKRGALLVFLTLWIYLFFVQYVTWFSGWVPLMAACAIITFMRSKKLFVVILLAASVYVGLNHDFYAHKLVDAKVAQGDFERLDLWQMNLQHIVNHPLFGMGPAGYAVYNMTYHPEDARSTHNNYFDVVAQTGILGFIAFIWLFITFLRAGNQLRRKLSGRRNFEEAFANATLAGCAAAMVAMMLGDWVLPFAYNQTITGFDNAAYTWMFLGGMVSLYRIQQVRKTAEQVNEPSNTAEIRHDA